MNGVRLGRLVRDVVAEAFTVVNSSQMVLQHTTQTFNTATLKNENVVSNYPTVGAEENYDARYMKGDNIQEGDVWVTIAAKGLPIVPKPGMNLFLGSTPNKQTTSWGEVKGVRKLRLNGVLVAYTLHVRGAS